MSFYKKNIILSPCDYSDIVVAKAVLSLEQFSKDEIIGTLKCSAPTRTLPKLVFGVMLGDNLNKIEVNNINENICFSIKGNIEHDEKISCVLLVKDGIKFKPIIWGSTQMTKALETTNILSKLKETHYEEVQEDIPEEEDIELIIDKAMEEAEDTDFEEERFNNQINANSLTEEPKEIDKNIFNKGKGDNFFALIEGQVEELLESYPLENAITQIIPNSKFVRVDYNDDGTYYIFGVIYEENTEDVKYICYGIPSMFSDKPPLQLDGFYQWLPVDADNPEKEGYFMMFQNAETGENIKMEVI